MSIAFVNTRCNVNILLEIKRTVSDFLRHLKKLICKLELDVVLTDFFYHHLTLSAWPWLQRDCCISAAGRIRKSEIHSNFGHLKTKPNQNVTVFMLFVEILYHVFINSFKSCVSITSRVWSDGGFESLWKTGVCLLVPVLLA